MSMLNDLWNLRHSLPAPEPRRILVTHPDNVETIREAHQQAGLVSPWERSGWQLVVNQHIPRYVTRWEPPKGDAFFEYEESDHDWLRYFGYGRTIETREVLMYVMQVPADTFTPLGDPNAFPIYWTNRALPRDHLPARVPLGA